MENIWSYMKNKIKVRTFKSSLASVKCLRKIWKDLSVDYAQALTNSLPNRLSAIIDNEGDWTIY